MCKSREEGGQRCAGHTRDRYNATTPADPAWDKVAAEYASTPEGDKHLQEQIASFHEQGKHMAVARLTSALNQGRTMREANKAAGQAIRDARPAPAPKLDRAELAAVIEEACEQNLDHWAIDPETSNAMINEGFYETEHFTDRETAIEYLRQTWREQRDAYLATTAANATVIERATHAALIVEAERFMARLT